jgi:hypothetical protein
MNILLPNITPLPITMLSIDDMCTSSEKLTPSPSVIAGEKCCDW